MLILILINVQHLWESAIGFEKDSNRQNDLSSCSLQILISLESLRHADDVIR